ncbi:hypothetical protein [Paenibacillus sp. HB172176]|uniref:hypothetical protein n=1 Tax=Paenibacillus sp. HB172176 TaxID=2493690 RepID=UPI00143BC2AF|nr:hypothetical protein [Paenibacillus sp. HB172176]
MRKSPLIAFLLSFIPGAGHAYLRRYVRAAIYALAFFMPLGLFMMVIIIDGYFQFEGGEVALLMLFLFFVGLINMIDMVVALLSGKVPALNEGMPYGAATHLGSFSHSGSENAPYGPAYAEGIRPAEAAFYEQAFSGADASQRSSRSYEQQQERTKTILLSIIPGLGHMSLGLMNRGITFLVSFIGLFAMLVFISVITGSGALLIFLLALPIIWIYSMFDVIGFIHAKHLGEPIADKSLFEDLEAQITADRKNKMLAIALAVFPGAGHLYLGLQKRGLQLMGAFLLAIYIMDNLRLTLFLFLLPLFWCFAFFDALQQASKYERSPVRDEGILPAFVPYQRWLGIGLLGFGAYYLIDRLALSSLTRYWPEFQRSYMEYKYMLPTAVIAFLMIVLGLRLAFGSKGAVSTSTPPPPLQSTAGGNHSQEEGGR